MWHSSVQLDFVSHHNCEAEFPSISYILVLIFPSCWVSHCESSNDRWQGKKSKWLPDPNFLCWYGEKALTLYSVSKTEENQSSVFSFSFPFLSFSFPFLCPGLSMGDKAKWFLRGLLSYIILWFPTMRLPQGALVECIIFSQGWSQTYILNFQPRILRHSL